MESHPYDPLSSSSSLLSDPPQLGTRSSDNLSCSSSSSSSSSLSSVPPKLEPGSPSSLLHHTNRTKTEVGITGGNKLEKTKEEKEEEDEEEFVVSFEPHVLRSQSLAQRVVKRLYEYKQCR